MEKVEQEVEQVSLEEWLREEELQLALEKSLQAYKKRTQFEGSESELLELIQKDDEELQDFARYLEYRLAYILDDKLENPQKGDITQPYRELKEKLMRDNPYIRELLQKADQALKEALGVPHASVDFTLVGFLLIALNNLKSVFKFVEASGYNAMAGLERFFNALQEHKERQAVKQASVIPPPNQIPKHPKPPQL